MFGIRIREYYYGDGTENVVRLTEKQADAVNKCRITETIENDQGMFVKTNLTPQEMHHYSTAADILNAYLETHEVTYNNMDQPMLRPVK